MFTQEPARLGGFGWGQTQITTFPPPSSFPLSPLKQLSNQFPINRQSAEEESPPLLLLLLLALRFGGGSFFD